MAIETFNFYKGMNQYKPRITLDENELYACEGFDLDTIGMLEVRTPKRVNPYPASGEHEGLIEGSKKANSPYPEDIVNPFVSSKLVLDFPPYDICSDGEYFYICGSKYYTATTNYVCKVIKVKISDLSIVDSIEYDDVAGNVVEYYIGIRYSNGYIYLAGTGSSGGYARAIIHARPTSNLSTLTWSYIYSAVNINCSFGDVEVDDDNVYSAGNRGTGVLLKVAVNKSTGVEVWNDYSTITSPYGLTQSGNYLYIFKHRSGIIRIEEVLKTDPTTYSDNSYTDGGNLQRGFNDGVSLFCGGQSPTTGDTQGLVQKTKISDMSETWQYRRNTTVSGFDDFQKVVGDGENLFAMGRTGTTSICVLEKLDLNGNLVISKTITGGLAFTYAIITQGDYLYTAGLDPAAYASDYSIQRRSKTTLEIS